jgi:hypothetical protein
LIRIGRSLLSRPLICLGLRLPRGFGCFSPFALAALEVVIRFAWYVGSSVIGVHLRTLTSGYTDLSFATRLETRTPSPRAWANLSLNHDHGWTTAQGRQTPVRTFSSHQVRPFGAKDRWPLWPTSPQPSDAPSAFGKGLQVAKEWYISGTIRFGLSVKSLVSHASSIAGPLPEGSPALPIATLWFLARKPRRTLAAGRADVIFRR